MEIIFFLDPRHPPFPFHQRKYRTYRVSGTRSSSEERGRRECRSRAASVRLDTTGLTQASQVVASVIITDREF